MTDGLETIQAKSSPAPDTAAEILPVGSKQTVSVQQLRPVTDLSPTPAIPGNGAELPSVFSYLDYRLFLKEIQLYRKAFGKPASNAYFARKGGIESPNYWGLILSGKRNLSQQTVHKFARAVALNSKESLFFEALVFFNQAKDANEKKSYFERLQLLIKGQKSPAFDLLNSQIEVLSHWYIVAIRELVSTKGFQEESTWITRRLRYKITAKQAKEAIDFLLKAGFLRRDPATLQLQQCETHLVYREKANFAIRSFHREFLGRSAESLDEDPIDCRNFSSTTITLDSAKFNEIKNELIEFIDYLSRKYADSEISADSVIQINSQLTFLTELPNSTPASSKGIL